MLIVFSLTFVGYICSFGLWSGGCFGVLLVFIGFHFFSFPHSICGVEILKFAITLNEITTLNYQCTKEVYKS